MTAEQLIEEMPKGLLKWQNWKKGANALYITAGQAADEVMRQALAERGLHVECRSAEDFARMDCRIAESDAQSCVIHKYDYAVIFSAVERSEGTDSAVRLLERVRSLLKEDGSLFLGMDNRLGIRYFCGDRDIYTGRNFDSIENYVRAKSSDYDSLAGRSYAKAEIVKMLEAAGFWYHRFYSVFPLLERPQILFAEDYMPTEALDVRIFPQYHHADTVFLEEERLYATLVENGLFHVMANGFLIECPLDGAFSNAEQVTVSVDRGRENAMFTVIRRDGKVEKGALYEEGAGKTAQMLENNEYLSARGIQVVEAALENGNLVMPYVKEMSALEYLRNLVVQDRELLFRRLDELWALILSSSEHTPYSEIDWDKFDPLWKEGKKDDPAKDKWKRLAHGTREERESIGVILKRGYIDLVPLNCFWVDGRFLFYDQEMYVEKLPAKVIMLRTIDLIYMGRPELDKLLPAAELMERYGLSECRVLFYHFVGDFLNGLRNDKLLRFYHKQVRRDAGTVNANRQRMNYSAGEYERIFRDIFQGADSRALYLFGSGEFAKQFLSQFGADYEVAGIIDNNPSKWGEKLDGIPVFSPDVLKNLEPGTFKVIICIKNYTAVVRQMQDMGIMDFSVYDSSLSYPRKHKMIQASCAEGKLEKKKYHVGYIAGVFDLFHIGHLNMFKRAKEQCDYLIVGVVTDEGVMNDKRTMPFVPFEERLELVRSCRYVDEAVEIPPDRSNTDEAYRRYRFDVQFSGSDYEHDEAWMAKREYLRKQGADLVFFPYTQSTSSSQIKDLINRRLM